MAIVAIGPRQIGKPNLSLPKHLEQTERER